MRPTVSTTMRPFTFIIILTLTTAGIILVCSYVDQKYSSSYSTTSAPSAEPLTANHGADKYKNPQQQKNHPMKVKAEKKHEAGKKFLTLAEGKVPAFQEVFDEETFYIFAGGVALGSVLLAFVASRFLTLSDPDDPDEILKRVRKWKIKNTEQGHPTMDDDAAAASNGSSSDAAAAAAASSEDAKAKDAKERSFLDYTDDDEEEDDLDNSDGDDSEEERELLRRVEEKFFRDRRQAPNVEAARG